MFSPAFDTPMNCATWGYSAELLAVCTFTSPKASTSIWNPLGIWRLLMMSLTEMPSAVKLLAESRAPFTTIWPSADWTAAVTLVTFDQPRP